MKQACDFLKGARKSMLDAYSDFRRMHDENDGNTQVLYLKMRLQFSVLLQHLRKSLHSK